MDDAQIPPEGGDAKSTSARRSRTRLSDVETVASTRLDMFGDNSLQAVLAGAPPDLDQGDPPAGTVEELPASEPPADTLPASDTTVEPVLLPPDPQHLDPAADAESGPAGGDLAGTNSHPATSDAPFGPSDADRLFEYEPDATGAASPGREVSSIFDALEAAERADEEHAEAPPASEPGSRDSDRSWEPEPADEAMTVRLQVSSIFDALEEAEQHAEAEPNDEEAAGATEPVPSGASELNGWRSAPADLISKARQEGDAVAEDFWDDTATGEPAEASLPAEQEHEEPSASEVAETPSDPPPMPSLPELSAGPPFPGPSGGPPDTELLHPPTFFRSELEPPPAPSAVDTAAKIAAEANATAEVLENLQRLLDETTPGVARAPPPPEPDWLREDAVSSPPLVGGFRVNPQPGPPHYAGRSAPLMPLPVPPRRSSRGVYVLGFLAGLGLSLMAGLVLYFFINIV